MSGRPTVYWVPAIGTCAQAEASIVSAARSSGSSEWILVLPQARANSCASMVSVCRKLYTRSAASSGSRRLRRIRILGRDADRATAGVAVIASNPLPRPFPFRNRLPEYPCCSSAPSSPSDRSRPRRRPVRSPWPRRRRYGYRRRTPAKCAPTYRRRRAPGAPGESRRYRAPPVSSVARCGPAPVPPSMPSM